MNKTNEIEKLIEEMNKKKTCVLEANFGASNFEFDLSSQSVVCVVDEHNYLIGVALGQTVIYSVDLHNSKLLIAHLENSVAIELRDVESGELTGTITFRHS